MTRPARRIIGTIAAALMLMTSLSMWALASPVGAGPDDDFHLASIWCGNGAREDLCGPGDDDRSREIPDKIAESACYAFHPEQDASCQGSDYLDEGYELGESTRVNTGNQYPSGFYFVSSFLASDNVAVSTILIRLLHSAIFTAMMIATWLFLPRALRLTLVASIALTFVPLGVFLIASVNPSSWALLSTAVLFPALLGFFATRGRQRIALGVISAVAALLGLSARGDAAAYTIVAVAAAAVLAFRPTKRFALTALLPLLLVVLAAVAFLTAGQTGLALGGAAEPVPGGPSKLTLLGMNLLSLPALWAGIFGLNWGLGWLDTTLHAVVWGATMFAFSGALFAALRWQGWRKLLALAGTGAAAVVVPVYILVSMRTTVGYEVQPRYVLPLITLFLATAIAPAIHSGLRGSAEESAARAALRFSPVQIWVMAVLLGAAQSVALYDNLRRYTGPGTLSPSGDVAWWWAAGPTPLVVWLLGSAAFAGLMALLAVIGSRYMRSLDAQPAAV
ncbi:DUF2142 domain-containing protein [Microbacterium oxydans]|jgi:hypothetical protein|uniref:DUF2142 domain-containing protein n=1 Tax=Microbacterium TaxID=33882 RepID=UPI000F8FB278|nr:DUF2142 domain-containing protein [Microbacterium oxydans]AZS47669.1 hypothetical protein CVS53_02373 [Microbacterium oxydans]